MRRGNLPISAGQQNECSHKRSGHTGQHDAERKPNRDYERSQGWGWPVEQFFMADTIADIVMSCTDLSLKTREKLLNAVLAASQTVGGDTGDTNYPKGLKTFLNPNAGFVVIGQGTGARWRLYVKDPVPANRIIACERVVADQAGDYEFPDGSGPLTYGISNNNLYRWGVVDSDLQNPKIRTADVTIPTDDDYWFDVGTGWVQKGRNSDNWWLWMIEDAVPAGRKHRVAPFNGSL